jgi:biopolymer transport protein ExbD/biopolymer transport protein TolR
VIDLVPFLSIFLVLLVMFMSKTPPSHVRWSVDLPKARSATSQPGELREDAIHIVVTRDGRSFFGGNQTVPRELPNLIEAAVRGGSERKIYLLADGKARNRAVEIVVDQIRRAGIADVVILANKP